MRVLLALLLLALMPGCSTYEKAGAPPTTEGGGTEDGTNGTSQPPPASPRGENEHIRVGLADHQVRGDAVTLWVDVTNKDAAEKQLGYAHLAVEGSESTIYFDVYRTLAGGDTARYELESNDDQGLARRTWTGLTLYWQEQVEGDHMNDRAMTVDLRGRGLPADVA